MEELQVPQAVQTTTLRWESQCPSTDYPEVFVAPDPLRSMTYAWRSTESYFSIRVHFFRTFMMPLRPIVAPAVRHSPRSGRATDSSCEHWPPLRLSSISKSPRPNCGPVEPRIASGAADATLSWQQPCATTGGRPDERRSTDGTLWGQGLGCSFLHTTIRLARFTA